MRVTRRRRGRPGRPDRPLATPPRTAKPDQKLETIRELCSSKRLAGTDAERRAANAMAERLRESGRRADVEPIYVHPQAPLIWAAHCALAFAGSVLSISIPAAGFALVLAASTSFYLDLNSGRHMLRLLFFRRASQNVVSHGANSKAAARLLLVAHVDAARSGTIFGKGASAITRRLAPLLPFPHTRILFWSAAILVPMLGARMAGIDTTGLSIIQLPPTLILLFAAFLLVDWRLSDVVPGANDNASGVAVALSLAAKLEDEPARNLDVWVVLTGGEECGMEGMRSFARSHRAELVETDTYVVAIDSVGKGDVRFVAAEGMTISFDMDRRLVELCQAVADADREGEGRYRATALRRGSATDALAARVRGVRATAITCLEPGAVAPAKFHTLEDVPDAIDPSALDRAEGFCLDLVRALDHDLSRAGSRPAPERKARRFSRAA